MKNIVVCSDGTGNTAIKGRGTNVFKLFEAVDVSEQTAAIAGGGAPPIAQIAFYDDGAGTQSFVPLKILGGAAGWGLSRNQRVVYRGGASVRACSASAAALSRHGLWPE